MAETLSKKDKDLVVKDWIPPKEWLISKDEFRKYSRELELHHSIFYRLWEMGIPLPDFRLETAAVLYDESGEVINFVFNPDFWRKNDEYTRKFILAHEMLHIVLHHGYRSSFLTNKSVANIALDIVVNETLVSGFGFNREKVKNWKNLCWIDTVFVGDKDVQIGQTFEYYYDRLLKKAEENGAGGKELDNLIIVDSHKHSFDGENSPKNQKTIKKLGEEMPQDEIESIEPLIDQHDSSSKEAGSNSLGQWIFIRNKPIVRKKKWETVIKKWAIWSLKTVEREVEQWARIPRRLASLPDSMMLPTNMPTDVPLDKSKISVWFFIDSSGSCLGMTDRFFHAAQSLPPDRFQVKLMSFDTKIYDLDIKRPRLRGGGGTDFSIIEQYIQAKCNGNYPLAVFVLTDGYGTPVNPEKPKNWYWFLSENYRTFTPKESNIYLLSDFE